MTRSRILLSHWKFSRFPVKARYVNDVHLPRFGPASASRRDGDGTDRPYTELATRDPLGHHGDSKDFSPSNVWNDSKTAVLRQLPRPPELARGKVQTPEMGRARFIH